MYDYGLSTLSQYPLTLTDSFRVRGALMCRTGEGLFLLREFHGSLKRLEKQQILLEHLKDQGFLVDVYLPNKEGALVSEGQDGLSYTLCRWYEGKECDTRSEEDIRKSIRLLAKLHTAMVLAPGEETVSEHVEGNLQLQRSATLGGVPRQGNLKDEYQRHNQELRKIRKFILKKGSSGVFETAYLSSLDAFLAKGEEALELLQASNYQTLCQNAWKEGRVCHGTYNQHQVLISGPKIAAVNFQNWNHEPQMADLYGFMRKILEKHCWNPQLARHMLNTYHKVRPISLEEWENLRIRFTYPEKYWKLADFYYTRKKTWISDHTVEKLQKLIHQRESWEACIHQVFDCYPF